MARRCVWDGEATEIGRGHGRTGADFGLACGGVVSRRFAVGWLEGDNGGLGGGPLLGESVAVMPVLLDRSA
jgi:hypothetical protein